jgi:hypothetical protein
LTRLVNRNAGRALHHANIKEPKNGTFLQVQLKELLEADLELEKKLMAGRDNQKVSVARSINNSAVVVFQTNTA